MSTKSRIEAEAHVNGPTECHVAVMKKALPSEVFNRLYGHLEDCSSIDTNSKKYQNMALEGRILGPDGQTQDSNMVTIAGNGMVPSCNQHVSHLLGVGDKMESIFSLIGRESESPKIRRRLEEINNRLKERAIRNRDRYINNRMFQKNKPVEEETPAFATPVNEPGTLEGDMPITDRRVQIKTRIDNARPSSLPTIEEPAAIEQGNEAIGEATKEQPPRTVKPKTKFIFED
jgi:hypothetical protein